MKIGIKDQNIIKLGNFHIYKTPFGLSNSREALRLAANKLSVKCKFVKKETEMGGDNDEE